jgi:hypothetical protein
VAGTRAKKVRCFRHKTHFVYDINPKNSRMAKNASFGKMTGFNCKAADLKLRYRIKRDLFTFQTLWKFFLFSLKLRNFARHEIAAI